MQVQESKSQRAADLLQSPTGDTGFVGFQTLGPSGLAAAGAIDESEEMSGSLRMLVAKLRKKDATTKLKVCPMTERQSTYHRLCTS